jgi:hypothetical protein
MALSIGFWGDSTFENHCGVSSQTLQSSKVPLRGVPKFIVFSRPREKGHYPKTRAEQGIYKGHSAASLDRNFDFR